ncbi:helix-turn-helix domain-containing protein [Nigerium massiliense]|uniref:helix-turn-helix domain-containing protein n=1 Tax=Nigerium massiliense TaxID=1522317 RepID=UPI00058E2C29|nr:helix-turn-helix transcriptional regulator [Nigerium massiliense]
MPTNEVDKQRARALVRTEMARQGLTFAALASAAEIDPGTLGKFLDGTRWPHIPTRAKIESALGLDPGTLSSGAAGGGAAVPTEAGSAPSPDRSEPELSSTIEQLRSLSPEVRQTWLRQVATELDVSLAGQSPTLGTLDLELLLGESEELIVEFTNRLLGEHLRVRIVPEDPDEAPILGRMLEVFVDEARRASQALLPVRIAANGA